MKAKKTTDHDVLRQELAAARERIAELEFTEQRYRAIFENAVEGIFQITPDGRFLLANQAMAMMLGYESPELLTASVTNVRRQVFVHDEDFGRMIASLDEKGVLKNFEGQFYRSNGEIIWLNFNLHVVKNTAEQVQYFEGTAQDITQRKVMENQLRRRESQLTEVQEMAHLGSWEWDMVQNCVIWTDELYKIYGLDKETFQTTFESYIGRVHPDDRERVQRILGKAVETAEPFAFEERIVRPDGTIRTLESNGRVMVNELGLPVRLVGSCLDVTDRKLAGQQIEEQSKKLLTLYQNSRDIISILDTDLLLNMIVQRAVLVVKADKGLILLVDKAAREVEKVVSFGFFGNNVAGIKYQEVEDGISGWVLEHGRPVLSEDMTKDDRNTGMALERLRTRKGKGKSIIVAPLLVRDVVIGTLTTVGNEGGRSFDRADLELVLLLANQAAIAIENARLYEASQRYTAVLEQRVSERTAELEMQNRQLIEARIRAEAADRLKSVFLAIMSHELRTPLNSIIGFTSIILQGLAGPLNAEQDKQLNMVRESAQHLLSLINDVLDISKIEAGQMELVLEPVDMPALIRKVTTSFEPAAAKKGLYLAVDVDPAVGTLTSDSRRVEQILINLVGNAVKFTEQGGVEVQCLIYDGRLQCQVKDSGIGIDPSDVDKLFQPFSQIESGLSRSHDGTGLGLSICKRLVGMLGGDIWVESERGRGSTFGFNLPLSQDYG